MCGLDGGLNSGSWQQGIHKIIEVKEVGEALKLSTMREKRTFS